MVCTFTVDYGIVSGCLFGFLVLVDYEGGANSFFYATIKFPSSI